MQCHNNKDNNNNNNKDNNNNISKSSITEQFVRQLKITRVLHNITSPTYFRSSLNNVIGIWRNTQHKERNGTEQNTAERQPNNQDEIQDELPNQIINQTTTHTSTIHIKPLINSTQSDIILSLMFKLINLR